MTRLARVISILRTTRWTWRRPRRGGVLVFDRYASDAITQLLAPGSYDVFDNHFEEINVPALMRTIIRGGRSWYDYCRNFVAMARPQLLVSAIDSNAHLYTFHHASPSTRVVVIQNGIRGKISPIPQGDLWSTLRLQFPKIKPRIDLMVTLGEAHSDLYTQHIKCNAMAVGSTRNNMYVTTSGSRRSAKQRVVFISQYSGLDHSDVFPGGQSPDLLTFVDDCSVTASVFHAVDGRVALTLAQWCAENDYEFVIIGRRTEEFPYERAFFEEWCSGLPFEFFPKFGESRSYELADGSDLVVTIDSTLGYEMLSRRKRVAFISARGLYVSASIASDADVSVFKFGYPAVVNPEGPMWTSGDDDESVRRVASYAMSCSDETWENVTSPFIPSVIAFDPGNVRLRAALAERGAVLA